VVPPAVRHVDKDRLLMTGDWTMNHGAELEQLLKLLVKQASAAPVLDLSGIRRCDTLGALVLTRLRQEIEASGKSPTMTGVSSSLETLFAEVHPRPALQARPQNNPLVVFVEEVGGAIVGFSKDIMGGIRFLGELMIAVFRILSGVGHLRLTAVVKQIEAFAYRSVPIICLISFLVGGIIAQQSVFQLRTFGTTAFVADLMGVLVLRELAVLLTAIMIAGRTGSAITAEIGSMKMREEIDALRTMGLNPMEVLVVPRILALVISLPLLTFLASIAGLFGGGLVAWVYGGVSPEIYLARLRGIIGFNTFMVGMIKAPVMALVIGIIATIEGMAVKGSAESLGQQTTASVVKAIFMVIVLDGLFAMFFAAIDY
jgi:phospholipid/cholesterol/gamma-HCH transport system permease protein